MTLRKLFEAPFAEITFEDVEALIREEAEEDLRFELKRELPANDRQGDIWMHGGRKIGDRARDGLAKEVVALANAYGGVIVVGVDETDDQPKRARGPDPHLIPRISDCAERLQQALDSLIDPPLPVLEVRGVAKPGTEDDGVLIIRTGASTRAPHGFGRPPQAYMRRGARSEPMTMRDLQSVLFETRSRGERIRAVLEKRRQAFLALAEKRPDGISIEGQQPYAGKPALYFRCTLVAAESLHLRAFELTKSVRFTRPEPKDRYAAFGGGVFHNYWTPALNGAETVDRDDNHFARWFFGDEGVVDAFGFVALDSYNDRNDVFYPGFFPAIAAQVLALGEVLRRLAKQPDTELVIETEFLNPGQATPIIGRKFGKQAPEGPLRAGPFTLGSIEDYQATFTEIERAIWHGLGLPVSDPLGLDLISWLNQQEAR